MLCPKCGVPVPEDAQACSQCGFVVPSGAGEDTTQLGSMHETVAKPGFDAGVDVDPDKNIRMDIDPLSSSGALDALNSLYDTGGMQFPIEGMEGKKRGTSKAEVGRWGSKKPRKNRGTGEPPSGRRKRIVIGVVVGAAVVAIAVAVFFVILFSRTNAISDASIKQVLEADESFMTGAAADLFVEPNPYSIQQMTVNSRDAWGDGLVVHATVGLRNAYFNETREVTLAFPYAEVTDGCAITIDSHETRAIRGISNDPEYGIVGANPTFDEAAQTCSLTQSFEANTTAHWWYSEAGEIRLAYEFSDDSWKRTLADTDSLTTSFQYLVGSYGQIGSGRSGAGFTAFAIKSVDDVSGAFRGTFSWTDGTHGPFGYGIVTGTFSGYARRDGSIEATSTQEADTLSFTGRLGEAQTMEIEGIVYYDTTASVFGLGDVAQASFGPTTLEKGATSSAVTGASDGYGVDDTEGDGGSGGSEGQGSSRTPYGYDEGWGSYDFFDIFNW